MALRKYHKYFLYALIITQILVGKLSSPTYCYSLSEPDNNDNIPDGYAILTETFQTSLYSSVVFCVFLITLGCLFYMTAIQLHKANAKMDVIVPETVANDGDVRAAWHSASIMFLGRNDMYNKRLEMLMMKGYILYTRHVEAVRKYVRVFIVSTGILMVNLIATTAFHDNVISLLESKEKIWGSYRPDDNGLYLTIQCLREHKKLVHSYFQVLYFVYALNLFYIFLIAVRLMKLFLMFKRQVETVPYNLGIACGRYMDILRKDPLYTPRMLPTFYDFLVFHLMGADRERLQTNLARTAYHANLETLLAEQ